MNRIKKPKQFVIATILLIILSCIFYCFIYFYMGKQRIIISNWYPQFLLEYTKNPRIIIDSGSNSLYSLDSYKLEQEFNTQTIVLADNAGFSLTKKLLRLEKYARKDDVIFLPLEWQYYTREKETSYFTDRVLGSLNYYYFYDSYLEELKAMANSPFLHTIKNIRYKRRLKRKQYKYLTGYVNKFIQNERGTRNNTLPFTIKKTCEQYILKEQLKNGFKLSEKFKKDMKILQRLKTKTKNIFLVWPTVVGNNCYSKKNKANLDKFIMDIKKYLQQYNIKILGNPYDNWFPIKDILDTYYHIAPSAMKIRTKNFIQLVKEDSEINNVFMGRTNAAYTKALQESKNNMLNLLNKRMCLAKEKITFKSSKAIFEGWSHAEKRIRWSLNDDAYIHFSFNSKDIQGILNVNMHTLGKQEISVSINNKFVGKQTVDEKTKKMRYTFNPNILNQKKINTIKFEFSNPHAPNGKDKRVLAMALKSLSIQ
ncbi:MAG: hypothetical protein CSA86_02590 [Arcobacter sp.]|nr:MAG: hypothetical protein CSA86_02590 [Arcobacter sp.]